MVKLPEGVPVMIDDGCEVYSLTLIDLRYEQPNGTAMTYADRLDRDKAIARAAFEAATAFDEASDDFSSKYKTADDYLQSEEFKDLIK